MENKKEKEQTEEKAKKKLDSLTHQAIDGTKIAGGGFDFSSRREGPGGNGWNGGGG